MPTGPEKRIKAQGKGGPLGANQQRLTEKGSPATEVKDKKSEAIARLEKIIADATQRLAEIETELASIPEDEEEESLETTFEQRKEEIERKRKEEMDSIPEIVEDKDAYGNAINTAGDWMKEVLKKKLEKLIVSPLDFYKEELAERGTMTKDDYPGIGETDKELILQDNQRWIMRCQKTIDQIHAINVKYEAELENIMLDSAVRNLGNAVRNFGKKK